MRQASFITVVWLCGVMAVPGRASLYGPWHRYHSSALDFQVPCVDDWQITEMANVVVFGMQMLPDPYVRLAVGRIHSSALNLDQSVDEQLRHSPLRKIKKERCRFAGLPAIRVEGFNDKGRVLDYYVDRGAYRYWIGVLADRGDQWDRYWPSIRLILSDFRFL